MAIINIEYNDKLQVVSKFGEKINQYSKNTDTISVKFDYNFKSSVPAVYLYAERNDRENNNLATTQLFYNSETNAFEYTLGSNDGDANTSWYTAIPGPIKLAFRIVDNEAVITTDVYKLWINASNMPGNEEVTLNADQFNNIVNYYQSIADLKLNISDEKVYYLKDSNHHDIYRFAYACQLKKDEIKKARIYFGLIGADPAIGLVNSDDDVTILTSTGKVVKVDREGRESTIQIPILKANLLDVLDTLKAANGEVDDLTITSTLDCSDATLFVGTPQQNTHAVNKRYVDEATDILHDRVNGIEAAQNLLDIVGTKAELNSWQTKNPDANLHKNDKIKVLEDESMSGAGTYYKWTDEDTGVLHWKYIGKDGNYYTQTEVDNKINGLKADILALNNLVQTLIANNVSYKEE